MNVSGPVNIGKSMAFASMPVTRSDKPTPLTK
jgi:hypothetical protein